MPTSNFGHLGLEHLPRLWPTKAERVSRNSSVALLAAFRHRTTSRPRRSIQQRLLQTKSAKKNSGGEPREKKADDVDDELEFFGDVKLGASVSAATEKDEVDKEMEKCFQ